MDEMSFMQSCCVCLQGESQNCLTLSLISLFLIYQGPGSLNVFLKVVSVPREIKYLEKKKSPCGCTFFFLTLPEKLLFVPADTIFYLFFF